jgi:Tol biopolymer transport system component
MLTRRLLLIFIMMTAACNIASSSEPVVVSIPAPTVQVAIASTITPAPTATMTQTPVPTELATNTSPPTETVIPSNTLVPTMTPMPAARLIFDNWEVVEIPQTVRDGLDNPHVVYINNNNAQTITNLSTAQPTTNIQVLYFAPQTNPANRIPIIELPASTGDHIYLAPHGNSIAYFLDNPEPSVGGIYALDTTIGLSGRILPIKSLVQHGIFSEPHWSNDGKFLAVTIDNGHELDIYYFDVSNSTWHELVVSGAFDFWPSWSPNGRYLSFVSDRAVCPSWIPGQPAACNPDETPTPKGGHPYVLEIATGQITQLSDQWTLEPPYWINGRLLAFATGDPFELLQPSRSLWLADVGGGTSREIRLNDVDGQQLNIAETWSRDGSTVIFQNATNTTEVVVMSDNGRRLRTIGELPFARYTLSAAWGPDGRRLAIGGSGGHCPYGMRMLDETFTVIATGNQPRSMCEPVFSPDGQRVAFTGFSPNIVDGRIDVFSASRNGYDAINLTIDLRGQMTLLGWVGP